MYRVLRVLSGILLTVGCGAGVYHGVRACRSTELYFQAKYGPASKSPEMVFRLSERAYRLYPWNYYDSQWAADTAYRTRLDGDATNWLHRLEEADLWTERGLRAHPCFMTLRQMKARLLSLRDPKAGLEYWKAYVEWAFWIPENHRVLLELAVDAGDLEEAMRSLRWLRGSPYYEEGRRLLRESWAMERRRSEPAQPK